METNTRARELAAALRDVADNGGTDRPKLIKEAATAIETYAQQAAMCGEFVEALQHVMIGGNHIASALINKCSPDFPLVDASYDDSQTWFSKRFGDDWVGIWDVWVCWKHMMESRDALTAYANHKKESQ